MDELRLKYLRETVQLWDALAEHPEWTKSNAFHNKLRLQHMADYRNNCPACEYARTTFGVNCDKCAIEEWRADCCFDTGAYVEWVDAKTLERSAKAARAIADLARENIKRLENNNAENHS